MFYEMYLLTYKVRITSTSYARYYQQINIVWDSSYWSVMLHVQLFSWHLLATMLQ